jgi:mRNA-degrading endonuclease RelE of RelBE toxin-antitoxin system
MKAHEYVLNLSSQARRQINRLPTKLRDVICQRIFEEIAVAPFRFSRSRYQDPRYRKSSIGNIRIFIRIDEEKKQIQVEAVTKRKSTYGRGNFVAGNSAD